MRRWWRSLPRISRAAAIRRLICGAIGHGFSWAEWEVLSADARRLEPRYPFETVLFFCPRCQVAVARFRWEDLPVDVAIRIRTVVLSGAVGGGKGRIVLMDDGVGRELA